MFHLCINVVEALCAARLTYLMFYNVGSGETVSINRLVDLLGGDKVLIPKRPGEPDSTFADISLIKRDLKWYPKVSIERKKKFSRILNIGVMVLSGL